MSYFLFERLRRIERRLKQVKRIENGFSHLPPVSPQVIKIIPFQGDKEKVRRTLILVTSSETGGKWPTSLRTPKWVQFIFKQFLRRIERRLKQVKRIENGFRKLRIPIFKTGY